MRKIKEVLRLHHELKLGQRQIARSASIGQSTVHDYLARAQQAGVGWPVPEGWDEEQLKAALYPASSEKPVARGRPLPDFAHLQQELRQNRHVTLLLLWEEYRTGNPEGYSYSQFCEHYQRWKRKQDVVLRQEHRAGEKLFVDWAGAKLSLQDRHTGAAHPASLFVAVLGASNYTYAEVTRNQELESWIGAHVRAFEFFGGVTKLVVPDNARTGVTKACRYEPDLNPTYQELAAHYGVGVMPARPYKPRDKAKVETGVQIVERWILAALRHRTLFSIGEANLAIGELLAKLNHRAFKKRAGSRWSLFLELDRPALAPLPSQRYDLSAWSRARVNIDYHVVFEGSFYSVPYHLTGQLVELRSTPATIEIFHRSVRVASHLRTRKTNQAVTDPEHRPKSHQAHLDWPPSRLVNWARSVGPHTATLFERILAAKPHPEMGYRSCLGLLRLGEKYTPPRMEAAAARALLTGACSYKSVKSILQHSLDAQPLSSGAPPPPRTPPDHDNIRGAEYFE